MKRLPPLIVLAASLLVAFPTAIGQEPGTSFDTALRLTEGEYTFLMDPGGVHFFKVFVEKGSTLFITVRMAPNQDFDLFLFSPLREFIPPPGVQLAGVTERIGYLAAEDGDYFFQVVSFGGSGGTYALRVSVVKPPAVTVTNTQTTTVKITETQTSVSMVLHTQTVERPVTVTSTVTRNVEVLPWSMFGLTILALAIAYAGNAISRSLRKEQPAELKPQIYAPPTQAEPQPTAVTPPGAVVGGPPVSKPSAEEAKTSESEDQRTSEN